MNLYVQPAKQLIGTVSVPPSKSYTHRAIILAALAQGNSIIKNPLLSLDTLASIDSCRQIGAEIEVKDNVIKVSGVYGEPKTPQETIDVKNSGTTLRIMTPVCSLCNGLVTLTGDESIQKRPMQPLLDALKELGVATTSADGKAPVTVQGPMKGGTAKIRGDISSQFISGLLIAAPLAVKETTLSITTPLKSKPYLDITFDIVGKFGGKYKREDHTYKIPGEQIYKSTEYTIESDYSSAALVLAAAAVTDSEVTVNNLKIDSKQGDRKIIDVLRLMGVHVKTYDNSVLVTGTGELEGIDVDLGDNPDIVPPVAVLGALARGKTTIKNINHLRYKESDRLTAMTTELAKMGAKIKAGPDSMEITGVKELNGAKLHGYNDHRIIMSLAIAALRAKTETVIDGAETIPVSFPNYQQTMKNLGAEMRLI
jgi:3-phosphoshikimate 1-carboxyvinyltransferase